MVTSALYKNVTKLKMSKRRVIIWTLSLTIVGGVLGAKSVTPDVEDISFGALIGGLLGILVGLLFRKR